MIAADLTGVSKKFRGTPWWRIWSLQRPAVTALHSIDLTLQKGEVLSIVGANGSGKTTLLKIIAGHLYHDAGKVTVLGHPLPAQRESIIPLVHYLAPNERSFYHRLTVQENLTFFTTLMGSSLSTTLGEDLLDLLNLRPLLNRRFGDLSTGQKQRVALGRALAAGGKIYLLDEPTRGLDDEGLESLSEWLGGPMRGDASVIMAFPREDPLGRFAGRTFRMEEGKIL